MAAPVEAPLPEIALEAGFQVVVTAVSPTDGSPVGGVNVSLATMTASLLAGSADSLNSGPALYVPGPEGTGSSNA